MESLLPIENPCADFFVTGNEYMRNALDLNFIPRANPCKEDMVEKILLANNNQNLRQSYLIAKNVFEHTKPGTIKLVLIGLFPYNFPTNDKEPPTVCPVDEKVLEDYFKLCLDNGTKPVVITMPVHSALKKNYDADVLKLFRNTINKVIKKTGWRAKFIDLLDIAISDKRFQDKSHLTSEGKAIVTALLSERLFFGDIISPQEILNANKDFFNILSKYFSHEGFYWSDDRPLFHYIFCKMACEDFNRLSKTMSKETCMDLMVQVFFELTYSYLASLAEMLSKDDYNELTNRIFKMTVENIRHKDKIKVGFYFEYSSHWCGDDLYNLLAQDEHFEPTIFVPTYIGNELSRHEFLNDLKKFKARGLNVFEITNPSLQLPKQDVIFRFYPYPTWLPHDLCLANLKVKEALLSYIPYSFFIGVYLTKLSLYNVSWKVFYTTFNELERHREIIRFRAPYGVYSGYPKLDVFFKSDSKFHFDWKMTRPDSKKIIWAPHHSIRKEEGGRSTFQWNYQFMYEFAKSHPEISWVVKPHPNLFRTAIWSKLFSSTEVLKEYFQKWDDLPNAQVYTGAYYQDIFATSDGMIHDSASFTSEYQYVNKPMIFLTREGVTYGSRLYNEIFKCSYLVDGKDLDGIAAMMQRVFIDGDDYKAAERKDFFDKYFNYLKINGMLASEFIFNNIYKELKGT